jgi:hypothetical protein
MTDPIDRFLDKSQKAASISGQSHSPQHLGLTMNRCR